MFVAGWRHAHIVVKFRRHQGSTGYMAIVFLRVALRVARRRVNLAPGQAHDTTAVASRAYPAPGTAHGAQRAPFHALAPTPAPASGKPLPATTTDSFGYCQQDSYRPARALCTLVPLMCARPGLVWACGVVSARQADSPCARGGGWAHVPQTLNPIMPKP